MAGPALGLMWCTFPDRHVAAAVGRQLVSERLVACATVLAQASSIYWWEGEVQEAQEVPLLCKVAPDLAPAAADRLRHLHPYDLPAVAHWTAQCDAPLADWARMS